MRYKIKNANISDQNGRMKRVNILTENKKIVKVSEYDIDVAANECDLSGYTILPGFIHTHVHLFDCFDGFNQDKLKKWLQAGVTCLRDEGILSRCSTKEAISWRDQNANNCMVPKIMTCGKFISAVNGYGGVEPFEVSTKQEARDSVKTQVEEGVDHIKIALDRGFDPYTQSLNLLPLNILEAICDEAHKLGKKVSAHVCCSDQLRILLEAGIDEAAHTCYDSISEETLEYMVRNKVAMTPTLSIYGEISSNYGAPFLDIAMDNTKRFVDLGGVIGLGNDYIEEKEVWSPVGMPIMEIELLRLAGLTMKQIIDAATIGGATIIGKEDYGKISENCVADLIAVKGNPYQIPYLLSNIQFVMHDGIVVKNI